jgi:hypothetical protein
MGGNGSRARVVTGPRGAGPALLSVLVVAHSCAYCSRVLVAPARVPMAKDIRALYTGARIVGGEAVETAR